MKFFFLLFLVISCSSDKKVRSTQLVFSDNEERLTFDWNKDGFPETVLIAPVSGPGEYRELVVYRGTPEDEKSERVLVNRNLIPRKARPGAKLQLQRDKSFLITVDNSESGRTSEVIQWKISWRKNRFLLTGMTRDWSDKLDPHDHRTCDVNLRSGRGKKNGKVVKFEPLVVNLIDLNAKFLPSICEF